MTFEGNSNKEEMYGGASSRPMAWSGGGSTQVSKLTLEVCSFIQEDIVIFFVKYDLLNWLLIWFSHYVNISAASCKQLLGWAWS